MARSVLDALAGRRPNRGGFVRATCPHCVSVVGVPDRTGSLAYNTRSGWWECWRCKSKGKLGSEDRAELPESPGEEREVRIELPGKYVPLWREPGRSSHFCRHAREYLAGRGVSDRVLREAEVGAVLSDDYQGQRLSHRVVAPIKLEGRVVGWAARSYVGAIPKVLYPDGMHRHLYNQRVLSEDADAPVYVVEGVFDAFALWPNAVACLGKPTGEHVELLARSRRRKVIALDGDAWRESEALYVKLCLMREDYPLGGETTWVKLPAGEDPGSLGRSWFEKEHDEMKTEIKAIAGEIEVAGKPMTFAWSESSFELRGRVDSYEDVQRLLGVVSGANAAAALGAAGGKPAAVAANGEAPKRRRAAEAPPAAAAAPAPPPAEASAAATTDAPAAAAAEPAAKPAPPGDDTPTVEVVGEDGVPEVLRDAPNVRTCVEWAMRERGATTLETVTAVLKPFITKVPQLRVHGEAKLLEVIEKRVAKIAAGG